MDSKKSGNPLDPSEQLINLQNIALLSLSLSQSFVFGKGLSVIVSTSVSSIVICCHFSLSFLSVSHTPFLSACVYRCVRWSLEAE